MIDDPVATRDLSVGLMNFTAEFEDDWFISVAYSNGPQVAAISRTNEFTPKIPAQWIRHPNGSDYRRSRKSPRQNEKAWPKHHLRSH